MLTIRCTQKLIKELEAAGHLVAPEPEEMLPLQVWYATLIRIERRKCVLFTHAGTLFSFFVPGLTRPDFKAFEQTFRQHLHALLQQEGIDVPLAQIAPDDTSVRILKTNSRRILGCMNELVFQTRHTVEAEGRLAAVDLAGLNHYLNDTLLGAPDYVRPGEAFRELVAEVTTGL